MGLDFTTPDAEAPAVRAPKGAAIVIALVAAAIAGLFLFAASPTSAVGSDDGTPLSSPLSIPLSIPWDGSVAFVNGSGETQNMTLSCFRYDAGEVAPWEALSAPSIVTVDDGWCVVTARLSAPQELSIDSERFTSCYGGRCIFQFRPGEDLRLTMKAPVERSEVRRDLSAPYLGYRVWSYIGQAPGVEYHDVIEGAWPFMSVPIDPDSLEVVDGPAYANAWVTSDRRIAVEVAPETEAPLDRLRYRLCGVDGRCTEDDLTLRFAQAPNPVGGTWQVPAEADPGIGWLDRSDPNYEPYWVRLPQSVEVVDPADFGTVTIISDGRQFAYAPAAGFKGVDRFVYQVCDAGGLCGEATVTLLVGDVDPGGEPTPTPTPTPDPGSDKDDPKKDDPKKDGGKLTDEQLKEIALKKLAEQDGPLTEAELKKLALEKLIESGDELTAAELKEIAFKKLADDDRFDDPRIVVIIDELLVALPAADSPVDETTEVDPKLAECTIIGTDGDDVLIGTPGPDVICGLGGDDIILGKGGNDVLRGGAGEDQLDGGPGKDRMYGGAGRDELLGKSGADRLRGGQGPDELRGGKGADRMWGNAGEDVLRGNGGPDRMHGGKGDDIILGSSGKDTASGGAGADRIWGGKGDDDLRGNAGKDVLFGNAGADRLIGGSGEDLIGLDSKIR